MKSLIHLLLLLKPFLLEIILSITLGVAAVGTGIGLLGTSSWLIASAALHPSIAELQVAIVGVRFFGISRGLFRYLERLISHSVNLHLLSNLREDFYQRIEPGAPANLHPFRSGDLLDRVMGDLEVLENFYVRVIAPVVVAVVITLGTSVFIGGYLVECAVILASGLIINGFLLPAITLLISRSSIHQLTDTRSEISSLLVENLQGFEDLQTNNAAAEWFDILDKEVEQAGNLQNRLTLINALGSGFSIVVANLTVIGVVCAAIPQVNMGELDGVILAVMTLIAHASFEATAGMPAAAANLNASLNSARRLFSIGKSTWDTAEGSSLKSISNDDLLALEEVSFSYPGERQMVLQDISFRLRKGQKKAIVGTSGAGKTSLLNLILRFQKPVSGRILLDGLDIQKIDLTQLHRMIGIVSQSPYIFMDSVRRNLLLAKPDASEEEMQNALQASKLDKWVNSLPDGLDAWVGEHGTKMSAGGRQRLALARIILQNPDIVLLDEPTANLDPVHESEVLNNIYSLFQDKGVLIVTHKPSLLKDMDEILILDRTMIVERGRMEELLNKGGQFQHLFELESDLLFPV